MTACARAVPLRPHPVKRDLGLADAFMKVVALYTAHTDPPQLEVLLFACVVLYSGARTAGRRRQRRGPRPYPATGGQDGQTSHRCGYQACRRLTTVRSS